MRPERIPPDPASVDRSDVLSLRSAKYCCLCGSLAIMRGNRLFTARGVSYNTRSIHRNLPTFQLRKDTAVLAGFLNLILLLLGLFLILLVLIQRGKGGGLAGAFGGVGGSSPFGSRAGDAFTKITLYMALVWGLLIMIHVKVAQQPREQPQAAQKS